MFYPANAGFFTKWALVFLDEMCIRDSSWQVNAEDPGSYNYLSMCNWGGVDAQCGSVGGKAYDIILAFKAPADGNAKIGEWNHFGYTNVNEDETYESPNASFKTGKATIMLNKEVLYTGDIKGVDNSGKSSVIEKEVKAGDMIYFVCNGGGNGAALNVSLDLSLIHISPRLRPLPGRRGRSPSRTAGLTA